MQSGPQLVMDKQTNQHPESPVQRRSLRKRTSIHHAQTPPSQKKSKNTILSPLRINTKSALTKTPVSAVTTRNTPIPSYQPVSRLDNGQEQQQQLNTLPQPSLPEADYISNASFRGREKHLARMRELNAQYRARQQQQMRERRAAMIASAASTMPASTLTLQAPLPLFLPPSSHGYLPPPPVPRLAFNNDSVSLAPSPHAPSSWKYQNPSMQGFHTQTNQQELPTPTKQQRCAPPGYTVNQPNLAQNQSPQSTIRTLTPVMVPLRFCFGTVTAYFFPSFSAFQARKTLKEGLHHLEKTEVGDMFDSVPTRGARATVWLYENYFEDAKIKTLGSAASKQKRWTALFWKDGPDVGGVWQMGLFDLKATMDTLVQKGLAIRYGGLAGKLGSSDCVYFYRELERYVRLLQDLEAKSIASCMAGMKCTDEELLRSEISEGTEWGV